MASNVDALFLSVLRLAREADEAEWDLAGCRGGVLDVLDAALRADPAATLSPASLAAAAKALRASDTPRGFPAERAAAR